MPSSLLGMPVRLRYFRLGCRSVSPLIDGPDKRHQGRWQRWSLPSCLRRRGESRPVCAAARHRPTTAATGAVVVSLGVGLRHCELRCYCASASTIMFVVVVVVEYQLALMDRSLIIGSARGADHVARAVKVLAREVA